MFHPSQSPSSLLNSSQLRESFLNFFKSKGHTLVPSSSLMPTSPNLLFTNAGMNPFVPHFLGETPSPYARIANTQKCIRAGGKHNDLEDVGFDTYHHTFFEMLGNWSFGDYFKKESIEWGWELLTKVWHFPKHRLYATVYKPGEGDPASFDDEAYALWEAIFKKEGMDPTKHIRFFGKKDNFWMMGETGPCGPCSEVHVDLTLEGNTGGSLVNADSPYCIEIWNHVFIQLNAVGDGTFKPLAQKHVDTGMGLERVAGIIANTKQFKDFSQPPSNYESDLFQDLFASISEQSGKVYGSSIPQNRAQLSRAEKDDCIFRILADHVRTLSFAIADGILPGNEGRNYVLRRILRRAVLFGKDFQLHSGFLAELAERLIAKMAPVFPELKTRASIIKKVLHSEEKAFEATLDRGLALLDKLTGAGEKEISAELLFQLYDTYGFPVDLTGLIAHERGLKVDIQGFEALMNAQRERARSSQKKSVIAVQEDTLKGYPTQFCGYQLEDKAYQADVLAYVKWGGKSCLITSQTPFYAEMGGQVGDSGTIHIARETFLISNTLKDKQGNSLHLVEGLSERLAQRIQGGEQLPCQLSVDVLRRQAIQRNHSATHLLHWALRKVLGTHVQQAGSFVGPDYFRFDFSHFEALSPAQLSSIQSLVQEVILANRPVHTYEVPFNEKPKECLSFFADKYGALVRVVQIGSESVELCGGTHVQSSGELGTILICSESAIAAGVRRIEATSGLGAFAALQKQAQTLDALGQKLNSPIEELENKLHLVLEQKQSLEKQVQAYQQKELATLATRLVAEAVPHAGLQWLVSAVPPLEADALRSLGSNVAKALGSSVVFLVSPQRDKLSALALCSKEAVALGHHAGQLVQAVVQPLGGKGGGKADFAFGSCPQATDLKKALENFKAERLV